MPQSFTHHPHDPPERKPRLRFRLLRALAARLPRRPIDSAEGAPYLERYYIAGPIPAEVAARWPEGDTPHPRLAWLLRRAWFLHRFVTPDQDPHMHTHPWDARGRILAGAYVEDREIPSDWQPRRETRVVSEGERTRILPDTAHRIARLLKSFPHDPAEVWTLLRCSPARSSWGFVVDGEVVEHSAYHGVPQLRRRS